MPENPYEPPKGEGAMDAYTEAVRRVAPHAQSLSHPTAFYRFARAEGCSKLTAMLLLRDLFNMNLRECMEVDACYQEPPRT